MYWYRCKFIIVQGFQNCFQVSSPTPIWHWPKKRKPKYFLRNSKKMSEMFFEIDMNLWKSRGYCLCPGTVTFSSIPGKSYWCSLRCQPRLTQSLEKPGSLSHINNSQHWKVTLSVTVYSNSQLLTSDHDVFH